MDEQFQRMSPKVFWQVFLTSRAACIMVCISSRLLRHNWACEDTSPGSSLQCWVWLMWKDGGEWDRTLWTKESAGLSIQTTPTTYQQLSANASQDGMVSAGGIRRTLARLATAAGQQSDEAAFDLWPKASFWTHVPEKRRTLCVWEITHSHLMPEQS